MHSLARLSIVPLAMEKRSSFGRSLRLTSGRHLWLARFRTWQDE